MLGAELNAWVRIPPAGPGAFAECRAEVLGADVEDGPRLRWADARPTSACTCSASTATPCGSVPPRTTSRSCSGALRRRSASAGRSCGSIAPSRRRTSHAVDAYGPSCCAGTRSGGAWRPTWRWPTRAGTTCRRSASRLRRSSGSRTRSRTSSARRTWRLIVLDVTDDYVVARLDRVGAMPLVNRIRDGINLAAKDAPIVSEHASRSGAVGRGRRGGRARPGCAAGQPLRRLWHGRRVHRALSMDARSGWRAAPGSPRCPAGCRRPGGSPTRSPRSTDAGIRKDGSRCDDRCNRSGVVNRSVRAATGRTCGPRPWPVSRT